MSESRVSGPMTDPAAQTAIVLRAEHLRVEPMSGAPLIEDVSFALGRGEILGIVGESGSGKTTSMLALLGMAHPGARVTAGTVHADGRTVDVTDARTAESLRGRFVSYVPQSPGTALNPVLRVRSALREMLRRSPAAARPPRQEWDVKIAEVLATVGLPASREFLRRFPHQLSGGQQQRVCIANSLLSGADVLILDEPTTGLDVITQASVLRELTRLRADLGLSMLYISHDLAVVSQIADRVMVMHRGAVVETGEVDRILRTPQHPYTRALLDASLDHRQPVAAEWVVQPRPLDPADPRPEPGAPVLEAEALTIEHRAGGRVVASVNDVSFGISRGSCLALLGESGSGKSTIARSVVGLKPRSSGSVRLDGVELAAQVAQRSDTQRRRLQMVFQNSAAALNPREDVTTAIERGRAHMSRQEAAQAGSVEHLLDLVRLPAEFRHRLPRELSGGERQRVCIARALGASPEVIVCDEITSALDVSVQASVLKLLKELQRDLGLSLLFITHDMGVVSYIADTVVVLDRGRVCEHGTTQSVLHRPQSEYVQRLMKSVPSLERR
jgi:peptide/nickel transport system ATP-binding protein